MNKVDAKILGYNTYLFLFFSKKGRVNPPLRSVDNTNRERNSNVINAKNLKIRLPCRSPPSKAGGGTPRNDVSLFILQVAKCVGDNSNPMDTHID